MGSLSFPGKLADPGWKSHIVTISLATISTAIDEADQALTPKHEDMQVDRRRVEFDVRDMSVIVDSSDIIPIKKTRRALGISCSIKYSAAKAILSASDDAINVPDALAYSINPNGMFPIRLNRSHYFNCKSARQRDRLTPSGLSVISGYGPDARILVEERLEL